MGIVSCCDALEFREAPPPFRHVTDQPAQRLFIVVVFFEQHCVCREEERFRTIECHFHGHGPGSMTLCLIQCDPLKYFKFFAMNGFPVECRVDVIGKVGAKILFGSNRIKSVLDFLFVSINRNIYSPEAFKTSCMIQMQMAYDDAGYVF